MERLVSIPVYESRSSHFLNTKSLLKILTLAAILETQELAKLRMGRTFYTFNDHKIYEVGFPVGEDAAFYVFIQGERHYFKTLRQAQIYIERIQSSSA